MPQQKIWGFWEPVLGQTGAEFGHELKTLQYSKFTTPSCVQLHDEGPTATNHLAPPGPPLLKRVPISCEAGIALSWEPKDGRILRLVGQRDISVTS